MKNIKINKFNQFFTQLYLGNSTIIITVCWVISSSHLTMLYKFENCVNYCDDKNTFLYITYSTFADKT